MYKYLVEIMNDKGEVEIAEALANVKETPNQLINMANRVFSVIYGEDLHRYRIYMSTSNLINKNHEQWNLICDETLKGKNNE